MKNPLKQDFLQNKKFTCNTKYLQNDDVFISINGGFKYLDEETLKKENDHNSKISYCKKIIKPSPEELELHASFLKSKFKKNYFN